MHSTLLTSMVVLLLAVLAIGEFERGNRHYRAGEYEAAAAAYRAAIEGGDDRPVVHYNLGTALLRLGRHEEARRQFDAALESVEPALRQRTFYNTGNQFLRAARAERDPAERRRLLDAATDAFKQALRLAPDDADAKWNLELALDERRRSPSPSASQQRRQDPRGRQGRQGQGARPRPRDGTGSGDAQRLRPSNPESLTREQAERLLRAVAQDERELLREQLKKGSPTARSAREW